MAEAIAAINEKLDTLAQAINDHKTDAETNSNAIQEAVEQIEEDVQTGIGRQKCSFRLLLTHNAELWFLSLDNATKADPNLLQTAFKEKFVSAQHLKWLKQQDLSTKNQGPDQTVEDYLGQIRAICYELSKSENETINIMTSGLIPAIRAEVISGPEIVTADDVEKRAKLAELCLKLKNVGTKPKINITETQDQVEKLLHDTTHDLQQQVQDLAVIATEAQQNQSQPNFQDRSQSDQQTIVDHFRPYCTYCNKLGHTQNYCFQRPLTGQIVCWNCNEEGHVRTNCPNNRVPQKWNPSQSQYQRRFNNRGQFPSGMRGWRPNPSQYRY